MPEKELVDWFGQPLALPNKVEKQHNSNPCMDLSGPGPEGRQCKECTHIVGRCHARI